MERLTERNKEKRSFYPKCFQEPCNGQGYADRCNDCEYSDSIGERLAEYEDTGLEPGEIIEHEEIFKAYRQVCGGRSPEEINKALKLLDAEEALRNKAVESISRQTSRT